MRISTWLRLTSGIVLSLLGLTLLTLVWAYRETGKANRDETLVAALQLVIMEKSELREEYLLRREERARRQWTGKAAEADRLATQAAAQFTERSQRLLLDVVRQKLSLNAFLFNSLAERMPRDGGTEVLASPLDLQRMLSQVIVNGYDLHAAIEKLRESARAHSIAVREKTNRAVIVLMLLAAFAAIGDAVSVDRILTKRVAALRGGLERMRSGDLGHRIAAEGTDELSDLARASNALAENLIASYTSLSSLEKEISARKKIEDVLRESEARYRDLFNLTSDAVYAIDQETGRFVDVNEAACRMYGYNREEWLRMASNEISAEPAATQKALQETPVTVPLRYHRKKDGTIFPLEITMNTFELNRRKTVIAAARDISERQRAEEAVRRANEELSRAAGTLTEKVRERTSELEAKILEIERMNDMFVDRELAMVALKERIRELESDEGRATRREDQETP